MPPEIDDDPLELNGATIEGTPYCVEELIGEGGFGFVYAALDTSLERRVALKLLRVPPALPRAEEARVRDLFIAEGKLLARLHHPNTVRVYGCGYHGAIPYLALEWLDGRSLTEAFAELQREHASRLTEAQVLELLIPAFEALAEAHALGVVHRDIKPDNLFVAERPGRASLIKVLDFGVGKFTELGRGAGDLSTATRQGRIAFTPAYGAPEQFFPKQFGSTGPWTDVHALGLVMIELVTGAMAFQTEDHELFVEATREPRPSPTRAGVAVSDAFEEMVRRCVALQPTDRFQNADELLSAAKDARRALGGPTSRATIPFMMPRDQRSPAVLPAGKRGDVARTQPVSESFAGHSPSDPTAVEAPDAEGPVTEVLSPPAARPSESNGGARGDGPVRGEPGAATGGPGRVALWVILGVVAVGGALLGVRGHRGSDPADAPSATPERTPPPPPSASSEPSAVASVEPPGEILTVEEVAAPALPKDCGGRDVGTQDINHGCSQKGCASCWAREGREKSQSLWACVGPLGEEACTARTCVGGDFADCSKPPDGTCETVVANDVDNCGGCGNVCNDKAAPGTATVGCSAGKCQYKCQPARGDCDGKADNGCEVSLLETAAHCGACGSDCAAAARANTVASCEAGKCKGVCKEGWGDCDGKAESGCEVDLTTTAAHCGACGASCDKGRAPGTTATCKAGKCASACQPGFGDCNGNMADGCEAALTSVSSCGACGVACAVTSGSANAVAACEAGTCVERCKAGFEKCADGCCAKSPPMVRDQ